MSDYGYRVCSVKWLVDHYASAECVALVKREWGMGPIPITATTLRRAAALGLSVSWWAFMGLPPPAHDPLNPIWVEAKRRMKAIQDEAKHQAIPWAEAERKVEAIRIETERRAAEVLITILEPENTARLSPAIKD